MTELEKRTPSLLRIMPLVGVPGFPQDTAVREAAHRQDQWLQWQLQETKVTRVAVSTSAEFLWKALVCILPSITQEFLLLINYKCKNCIFASCFLNCVSSTKYELKTLKTQSFTTLGLNSSTKIEGSWIFWKYLCEASSSEGTSCMCSLWFLF